MPSFVTPPRAARRPAGALGVMSRDRLDASALAGWPLPDQFLIELGRLTVLWAALESLLMLSLGKLAGFNDTDNPIPFILVAHASFPQRLDMLGALCEQHAPQHTHLAEYGDVLKLLRAAQKARNRFIHNGLVPSSETGQVEIAIGSARGSLKVSVAPVEPADIRKACKDVHEAQRALAYLVFRTSSTSKFQDSDA